jgi:arylsulfatase A-like enzyme
MFLLYRAERGAKTDQPNIIFVLTDDQRQDAMGCVGDALVHTPNIDSLADWGVRFENAFVTLSICNPIPLRFAKKPA